MILYVLLNVLRNDRPTVLSEALKRSSLHFARDVPVRQHLGHRHPYPWPVVQLCKKCRQLTGIHALEGCHPTSGLVSYPLNQTVAVVVDFSERALRDFV